jgi:hypothetical protein
VRWQLRDYRVKPGEMSGWLDEWSVKIRPLREKFGFRVAGGWAVTDQDRFVWIIGHEDFEAADKRYYASEERRALDPDPARHLAATDLHFVEAII